MAWIRLRLQSTAEQTEEVSDLLFSVGASSVVQKPADGEAISQEDPDQDVWEPRPGETPLWDRVFVEAFFAIDADLADCRTAFAGQHVEIDFVEESDWSDTWRNQEVQRFGRLMVVPTDYDSMGGAGEPGDVLLHLDPGLAFGSGTHPTTALCLAWLEAHMARDRRVLDVGSGSGILSIASLLLGAREVVAVDYDDQALMATVDNATRNAVAARLTSFPSLADAEGPFDVVVANILAAILIDLADELATRIAADGDLVLSGVLESQAEWVKSAFEGFAWRVEQREEWVLLCGRRTMDAPG